MMMSRSPKRTRARSARYVVPQLGETLVDLLALRDERGVVALGESVQDLTPLIREALDLSS